MAVWYMLTSNDVFELPVLIVDTAAELAEELGIRGTSVLSSLLRSPDGYVTTIDRKWKYFRMDSRTGKIFVGKLPKDVAAEKSRRKPKKGKRYARSFTRPAVS